MTQGGCRDIGDRVLDRCLIIGQYALQHYPIQGINLEIETQMKINPSESNDHREALLICHCFGYTKNDLVEDFACNGKSLMTERIIAEKKLGGCQCATKNPSGK
jgi:hypothetical protein